MRVTVPGTFSSTSIGPGGLGSSVNTLNYLKAALDMMIKTRGTFGDVPFTCDPNLNTESFLSCEIFH